MWWSQGTGTVGELVMDFNPIAKKNFFCKLECLFNIVGKASEDELAALDPYELADTVWVDDIAK